MMQKNNLSNIDIDMLKLYFILLSAHLLHDLTRSTAEKRRLRNSSSSREDLLERNEHKRVSDEYESEKRGHRIRHMYGK